MSKNLNNVTRDAIDRETAKAEADWERRTRAGMRTVRMTYPKGQGQNTLNGYVFAGMAHARAWLMQPFVRRSEIRLEEVEVGDICRCRHCDGLGFTQSVTPIRKLTCDEFLKDTAE